MEDRKDMNLPPTRTLRGVEIFRVGTWNGTKFNRKDLEGIVNAFKETKTAVKPFLKLGHNDEQSVLERDDLPAAGWVDDIRMEGNTIVADFVGIPQKIFDLIEAGAFRGRSIEIWREMKVAGKTHPWLLTAVALLGSEVPAVDSLDDMIDLFAHGGEVHKFEKEGVKHLFSFGEDQHTTEEAMKLEEALKALADEKSAREGFEKKARELEAEKVEFEKAAGEKDAKIEALTGELAEAKSEVEKFQAAALEKEIDAELDKLVHEKKINPSQKPALKVMLSNLPTGEDCKKFSIGEKKDLSLKDVLMEFAAGGSAGLKTEEEAETPEPPKPEDGYNGGILKMAREYIEKEKAEGREVSLKDALLKFGSKAEAARPEVEDEDGDE